MRDAVLREAFRRLASCDARLPIDTELDDGALARAGWTRASDLAAPDAWPAVARQYAAGLDGARVTVGGSCALQGYAWRVAGLAIGTWALTGTVLDLGPGRVRVLLRDGRTVGVAAPDPRPADGGHGPITSVAPGPPMAPGSPVVPGPAAGSGVRSASAAPARDAEALADELLGRHLAPVVAASRTVSRLSARVAWGNVASACASVVGLLDRALPEGLRADWRADARALLRATAWPARDLVDLTLVPGTDGDVLTHERRTCCLMRLAPGKDECGTCERRDPAERRARLTQHARTTAPPGPLAPLAGSVR